MSWPPFRKGWTGIIPLLKTGGRIAVISFHSLEDRIVKRTFVAAAKGMHLPAEDAGLQLRQEARAEGADAAGR